MKYNRVPAELKSLKQWHVWSLRNETKIPLQCNGTAAKSNDPSTWSDFETAESAAEFHSGLAFEITDPYTGIDLDNCFDSSGLRKWAWQIVARLDGVAYAEISPSGNGIKFITRARKSDGSKCVHKTGPNKQQIECYDATRFWAITGDCYAQQDVIADGQSVVDWICETYLSKDSKSKEDEQLKPVEERKTAIFVPPIASRGEHIQKRAEAYLAAVPQAAEGERNIAAFKLSGNLFAIVGERSERLSDDSVVAFLRTWNFQNSKPLSDSELLTACFSAKRNGTPRADKLHQERVVPTGPPVDLSGIIGDDRPDDFDDEEFCSNMVPEYGIIRSVYDYYCMTSQRTSSVMGLCTAVSLCETIFGRRVASHTDLRTNDYNVIIAPTSSGKEACETTIMKIFEAADAARIPMIPPDVQSGNGLLKAISASKCAVWVCDEFGKMLESILDRKSNNGHAKQIGTHLLKLYGKSAGTYGGAAHADGIRNSIVQPHLCLLGLTTGQIFESIDSRQIQDGLFGRLAFWPVQDRPKRRTARSIPVFSHLAESVRQWIVWQPASFNPEWPMPATLEMTPEALDRWEAHADAIDQKMSSESESRAAIWGRVAARAMKLAMVSRCSRLCADPASVEWTKTEVEEEDVNWGIGLANWLARIACGLIRENVMDLQAMRAEQVLLAAIRRSGPVSKRDLMREFRSISGSEFLAAAENLKSQGMISIERDSTTGRPRILFVLNKPTEGESLSGQTTT